MYGNTNSQAKAQLGTKLGFNRVYLQATPLTGGISEVRVAWRLQEAKPAFTIVCSSRGAAQTKTETHGLVFSEFSAAGEVMGSCHHQKASHLQQPQQGHVIVQVWMSHVCSLVPHSLASRRRESPAVACCPCCQKHLIDFASVHGRLLDW